MSWREEKMMKKKGRGDGDETKEEEEEEEEETRGDMTERRRPTQEKTEKTGTGSKGTERENNRLRRKW